VAKAGERGPATGPGLIEFLDTWDAEHPDKKIRPAVRGLGHFIANRLGTEGVIATEYIGIVETAVRDLSYLRISPDEQLDPQLAQELVDLPRAPASIAILRSGGTTIAMAFGPEFVGEVVQAYAATYGYAVDPPPEYPE